MRRLKIPRVYGFLWRSKRQHDNMFCLPVFSWAGKIMTCHQFAVAASLISFNVRKQDLLNYLAASRATPTKSVFVNSVSYTSLVYGVLHFYCRKSAGQFNRMVQVCAQHLVKWLHSTYLLCSDEAGMKIAVFFSGICNTSTHFFMYLLS
jgi:hypothetical protein